MIAYDEPRTSGLAMLGDGGVDAAEVERRAARFRDALRQLRDDPAERARIDAIVRSAERARHNTGMPGEAAYRDWRASAIKATAPALNRGQLALAGHADVLAGTEVARCYLPVSASVAGGDWHDIVPLSGGRAALIVGDAMGHGPEAVAAMAQLRAAAHVLAGLELAPEEVLRRLDQLAAGFAMPRFATCIYSVIDPAGGSCLIAQAGHLPPVLAVPGGTARVLDLPPGLPLGIEAESFEATRISLPPGATLALYTDGLVESRARPLDDGLAALRDALSSALAEPGATLEGACETVTRAVGQHSEDDVTLVLARARP